MTDSLNQKSLEFWNQEVQMKINPTEIAIRFLEQYYSITQVEKPVLKNGIWIVEVTVASPVRKKFQVKIDAKTGYIVGY